MEMYDIAGSEGARGEGGSRRYLLVGWAGWAALEGWSRDFAMHPSRVVLLGLNSFC